MLLSGLVPISHGQIGPVHYSNTTNLKKSPYELLWPENQIFSLKDYFKPKSGALKTTDLGKIISPCVCVCVCSILHHRISYYAQHIITEMTRL